LLVPFLNAAESGDRFGEGQFAGHGCRGVLCGVKTRKAMLLSELALCSRASKSNASAAADSKRDTKFSTLNLSIREVARAVGVSTNPMGCSKRQHPPLSRR
jgi:hypothetical protein